MNATTPVMISLRSHTLSPLTIEQPHLPALIQSGRKLYRGMETRNGRSLGNTRRPPSTTCYISNDNQPPNEQSSNKEETINLVWFNPNFFRGFLDLQNYVYYLASSTFNPYLQMSPGLPEARQSLRQLLSVLPGSQISDYYVDTFQS